MAKSKLNVDELVRLLTDVYEVRVLGGGAKIVVRLVDTDDDKRHEGEGPSFEAALQACAISLAKAEASEAARLLQEASSSKDLVEQLRELGIATTES